MIGAIAGDIIGSRYEFNNISNDDFPLFERKSTFTDDSVLTIATADVILDNARYSDYYYDYATSFPNRGYGGRFGQMLRQGSLQPYNSYGNGSAMRVSPIGWMYGVYGKYEEGNYQRTLDEAKRSAECTHDHPEGIKGAQAVAASIFIARLGGTKADIRQAVEQMGYDVSKRSSELGRTFDETCQGTIPKCMAIFFETNDYESAIRKSIAMGGDVDTIACIVGGISQAHYGMPSREIVEEVYKRLPAHLAKITTKFTQKYIDPDFIEPKEIGTDGASNL